MIFRIARWCIRIEITRIEKPAIVEVKEIPQTRKEKKKGYKQTLARCISTSKIMYPSKESANQIAENQQKNSLNKLRPYKCQFCEAWHITHKKNKLNFH